MTKINTMMTSGVQRDCSRQGNHFHKFWATSLGKGKIKLLLTYLLHGTEFFLRS